MPLLSTFGAAKTINYYPRGGPLLFDFTLGSAPPGIIEVSNVAPDHYWTGGYLYFDARTNDPNDVNSYPIRVSGEFSGDYLIQLSHALDDPSTDDCSDASIGLFDTDTSSNWVWKWASNAGRIAVQNNCSTPTIYGTNSNTTSSTDLTGRNGFITMHMYHRPSTNSTQYIITLGQDDWDRNGSQITNITLGESFSSTYWIGIAGDSDDYVTRQSALRVSEL